MATNKRKAASAKAPKRTRKAVKAPAEEPSEDEVEPIEDVKASYPKMKDDWISDEESEEENADKKLFASKRDAVDSDEEQDNGSVEEDFEDRENDAMETFALPQSTEEAEAVDPSVLLKRIEEVLSVLNDFRAYQQSMAEKGLNPEEIASRSSFTTQLEKDCAAYYGYLPSLISLFFTLFSPSEAVELLEANEQQRPVVIRTNTLRTRRKQLAEALIARGVNLKPLEHYGNVGLTILDSSVPIGATPEYLAGHYMLQAPSSFCPVVALDPQPNERILDMASAPGGKTSFVAQLMENTGVIVANEINLGRMKATISNLARLGCSNVIHVNLDGREFPKIMGGFDRVLLDAPCSGLGVICRDPSVKLQRDERDIKRNSVLQRQLLLSAIDSVNHKSKGGIVVYSTCSLTVEENEMVIQYALDNRNVKLVDAGLEVGKPAITKFQKRQFHPSMKLARRFYPHVHNTDGFFVAKLKKISSTSRNQVRVAFDKKLTAAKKKKLKRKQEEAEQKAEEKSFNDLKAIAAKKKTPEGEERAQKKTKK